MLALDIFGLLLEGKFQAANPNDQGATHTMRSQIDLCFPRG
jgi:hypothetical protein